MQNPNRAGLDIVSPDPNFGTLKVSPVFYLSDADMEAYLEEHNLPNEWDYFDPAKADEKRECGLHAAWGRQVRGAVRPRGRSRSLNLTNPEVQRQCTATISTTSSIWRPRPST